MNILRDIHLKIRHFKPASLIRAVRSVIASRKVTECKVRVPIRIVNTFQNVKISVAPTAKFVCNGFLKIEEWEGGNDPVFIRLEEQSELIIDGDFTIGNGTRIIVDKGASLYIGGQRYESASGITENSMILVKKKVHIGRDCIIAWNVLITDSDRHAINGKTLQQDVTIGDHVWIACNVSILKGAEIGDNCIISAHSVVSGKTIPDQTLAGGNPVTILANNIQWNRDIESPVKLF